MNQQFCVILCFLFFSQADGKVLEPKVIILNGDHEGNGEVNLRKGVIISSEPNQTYWQELCNLTPSQLNFTSPVVSPHTSLIILIPLLPKDWIRREVIRNYFLQGNYSESVEAGNVTVLFVSAEPSPSAKLVEEADAYGDILIVPGEEGYKRLVYKLFLAYRWVNFHYSTADLAKVDSDVVLLTDNLYKAVTEETREFSVTGHIVNSPIIIREINHRWYVSESLLNGTHFPTYVNGPTYFFKSSALMKILIAAPKVPVIEVEDAYFTGLLTKSAGVEVIENIEMYLQRPSWAVSCDPLTGKRLFISYQVDKDTETMKEGFDTLDKIPCRKGSHLGILFKILNWSFWGK